MSKNRIKIDGSYSLISSFPFMTVLKEIMTLTLSPKAKVSNSVVSGVACVNNTWCGITWPSTTFSSIRSDLVVG